MNNAERGVVLPIVLLTILALGSLATSALLLARTEMQADRAGHRDLRERFEAERLLRAREQGGTERFQRVVTALQGGFRLVEARPRRPGPSHFGVEWVLDPDSVVAMLPQGLLAADPLPAAGVEALPECLVRASGTLAASLGPSPLPDPLVRPSPRLGILRISDLLALAAAVVPDEGALPPSTGPTVWRASAPTTAIRAGAAAGLLVAAGDLTIEGNARFAGLLFVEGDLTLRHGAVVEGTAIVGGRALIEDVAKILACPDRTLDALRHPAVARGHPIPGGYLLGRY